jgi:hypothetical protein
MLMSEYHFICDPYVNGLSPRERQDIDARRLAWGIPAPEFYRNLDRWLVNFKPRDKPLAHKILLNVQYFNPNQFEERILQLRSPVDRFLSKTDRSLAQILLVVSDDLADSAERHAYDVIKKWGLKGEQVVNRGSLSGRISRESVIVFFNDTHGTGNQFLREMLPDLDPDKVAAVFVIAITISKKAIQRFDREIPKVRIIPGQAMPDARDIFTASEFKRIQEIGAEVYPTHPVGYGDAALLTVYYFQCPNNALPLIWADGENNAVGGKAHPWQPLFPYRPKAKSARADGGRAVAPVTIDSTLLGKDCEWCWTDEELAQLVKQVAAWGLESPAFYERVGRWFRNFKPDEKELAYRLFLSTRYLNLEKVRQGIRTLRNEVLTDIENAGGDMSDVLLVTTGDHKNSVYHYVYEFIKIWGLTVDQVCSVQRLSQDKVIDKTLVAFYHTRPSANHFMKNHADAFSRIVPRATFIAAYAMTLQARAEIQSKFADRMNCVYLEEASATVLDSLPKSLLPKLDELRSALLPEREQHEISNEMLVAYYFQCPDISSPLLWAEQRGDGGKRSWAPLFKHVRPPA